MPKKRFEVFKAAVTTTGSAGSATGSATVGPVNGKLYAVHLNYHASAPGATTDVTITQGEAPAQTLLTVTDNATDGWYFPRLPVHSPAGAGLTYDGTRTVNEPAPVAGNLTVAVAQSNALTNCLVAYIYVER